MGQPKTIIRIPKRIAQALAMYKAWARRASSGPLDPLGMSSTGLPLEITYRETGVRISDLKTKYKLHEMRLRWERFTADVTIEVHDAEDMCLHEVKTREGDIRKTYDRDQLKPPSARWPDDFMP